MRLRVLVVLSGLVLAFCAHGPHTSSVKDLKHASDAFFQSVRWNDFVGTGQLLVPSLRGPYFTARDQQKDERDLNIADCETLDIQMTPDRRHGVVLARVQWTRLPSVTLQTKTVTTDFVYENDAWMVERMRGGPFDPELNVARDSTTPAAPEQNVRHHPHDDDR